jgi:hypothetical protein
MRFLICILSGFWYADVHATPCEDTAYVRLGKLHSEGRSGDDSALYSGKNAECDDGSHLSAPVIGIGILSLVFGAVSLFQAYGTE